mmetsp:Transcript_59090/g.105053  ORF Transcript_59090/g.105053 Transcript_59090/m.105053 type:complete len:377 (+) Transcript_59090:68-1198(+)
MDDEDLEYTLLTKREVLVYQIPPASSSSGHKADDWKNCIWRGKMRIVGKGKELSIKLVDGGSGNLFAQCSIPGGDHTSYVERVIDSSRYFVLKIRNGERHAFVGLGFEDRNDAFDFNCTLSDFKSTWVDRAQEAEKPPEPLGPSKDLSLKDGQKIKINIAGLGGKRREKSEATGGYGDAGGGAGFGLLAPPPASGGASRRQAQAPAAPQIAAPAPAPQAAPAAAQDDFGDFDDFQAAPAAAQAAPQAAPIVDPFTTSPAAPFLAAPAAAPAPATASLESSFQQLSFGGSGGFSPASDPFGVAAPKQAPAAFSQPPGGFPAAPASKPAPAAPKPADPFAGGFGDFGGFSGAPKPAAAPQKATTKKVSDPFDDLDIFK